MYKLHVFWYHIYRSINSYYLSTCACVCLSISVALTLLMIFELLRKKAAPTWTFQFGCQMVPLQGGKINHPLGFKEGTP